MDDPRGGAVAALVGLGRSESWADRRDAAVALASFLDSDDAQTGWIETGVGEGVGWHRPDDRELALSTTRRLLEHPEPHIRVGAQRLLAILTGT